MSTRMPRRRRKPTARENAGLWGGFSGVQQWNAESKTLSPISPKVIRGAYGEIGSGLLRGEPTEVPAFRGMNRIQGKQAMGRSFLRAGRIPYR